jgi:hypothetical protein
MHFTNSFSASTALLAALLATAAHSKPHPKPDSLCSDKTPTGLTQLYYPPKADCVEYMIPITITSDNIQFSFPEWKDNYELMDFIALATTRASANLPSVAGDVKSETGTYNIAASFCTPKKGGAKAKNVILATHGIGQARSHCKFTAW